MRTDSKKPSHGSSRPLCLAVDGRSLCGTRTGVGTYTANLLEGLLHLDDALEILVFTNGDLPDFPWEDAGRVKVIKRPRHSRNNLLWSHFSLRPALAGRGIGLFHSPSYTLPLRLPIPAVVTIHDVVYAAHPEWYPHHSGMLRRMWYRASALSARHVLTVSEFSRREILRVYPLVPDKVSVVYPGVDRQRFRNVQDPGLVESLRNRYGLRGDFLLFVGDIHRRRNIGRIIQAFGSIKDSSPAFRDLELVLIGRVLEPETGSTESLHTDSEGAIRRLGYVSDDDLPLFYSLAKAFVFPSLYEGFGFGVAEAMACGCPVIVGRSTACDEVAGEAGICVDPTDVKSIAEAARSLLSDRNMSANHAAAGLRRSAEFSWDKTAEATLSIYRVLADTRRAICLPPFPR